MIKKLPWWFWICFAIIFCFINEISIFTFHKYPDYFIWLNSLLKINLFNILIAKIEYYWIYAKYSIASLLFITGLLAKKYQQKYRQLLYKQNHVKDLYKISWQEFEKLLKEVFLKEGYKVSDRGGARADGGVDLVAHKRNKKVIIQCKQWKRSKVGVNIAREMYAVMIHEKAQEVYIVTCGAFTKDAEEFAKNKPMKLVNGLNLIEWIKKIK